MSSDEPLRRAPVVRIYDVGDRTVLLAADGAAHTLAGDSAALARAALAFFEAPRTLAELRAHIEDLAGAPLPRPAVLDELVALLRRVGALEPHAPRPAPPRGPGPRVVLGLTGAVATMHAPALVQRLQSRGYTVRVAATPTALRFVRAEALAALTHHPVVLDLWPTSPPTAPAAPVASVPAIASASPGPAIAPVPSATPAPRPPVPAAPVPAAPVPDPPAAAPVPAAPVPAAPAPAAPVAPATVTLPAPDLPSAVPHLDLAQWADLVLVCPASATTIARLATGDHASIVAAVALATRAPVLVVPSMNPAMYASPAVRRNLETLAADGLHVAHPARGLEVADAPDERAPVLGGAPPPDAVAALVAAVLRARPPVPRDAAGWDRLWRTVPAASLPWQRGRPDDDLLAALDRLAPAPTSVLELGAGLGVHAVAAAARGHRVVATDLSEAALEHAHLRAPDAPVVWLADDVAATRLRARFAVVLDRACLHVLSAADVPRWAAAVARLTAPGGVLLLKVLADAAPGVTVHPAAALRALLAGAFDLEDERPSTLPGPDAAPAARLFVFRRRGADA
jgi:SAM-dependent methyltransferase/3-polyprenyl-4-hydroxybenzoate decarboxylase